MDHSLNLFKEKIMSHTDKYKDCIKACLDCFRECNHCASACLEEDDVKMMAKCIASDMDCADICATTAAAMARGSEHIGHLCRVCAEICEACGAECERHDADHCQKCAEACKRCAQECRKMAA
tara:strand:+ start:6040 stop:6408 length:369 start_codon:yes stop_codon:yes gene_type:complete